MAHFGFWSQRVDEAHELGLGFGLAHETDQDADDEVGGEGPDGGPEVLRHIAGIAMDDVHPAAVEAGVGFDGEGEAVVQESRGGAGDEADEGSVAGGPLPEHTEEEGGEERRVDEAEDELERVHDVVEAGGGGGGGHGSQGAADG